MISIVLTIHNQEEIIERVIKAIHDNSSDLVNELMIVFDGCTDNSEQNAKKELHRFTKQIKVKYTYTRNVFETRANNAGLRLVLNPYAIIVQDDCIITEKDFDKRLIKPILEFDDVWAVSGRNAHNLDFVSDLVEVLYPEATGSGTNLADRNKFYLRQVINRGPMLLDMKTLKTLNYFDEEFAPQNQDDHDLMLRAWFHLGLRCGSYLVGFDSDPQYGGTRKPGASDWFLPALFKNFNIMRKRYQYFYRKTPQILPKNEERSLS